MTLLSLCVFRCLIEFDVVNATCFIWIPQILHVAILTFRPIIAKSSDKMLSCAAGVLTHDVVVGMLMS